MQADLAQKEKQSNSALPDSERWVLFATILASSMAFIDSSALNVALPTIQADLHASGAQLLWIINAYLLMLAALIMIGGSLGDKLGRKKVFLSGIGLFLLASLACGLGFLLLSFVGLTNGPSDYWTTFLPGILVFGIGMAVTVAPLTTAVMGSVAAHYAGTASGINNAVSRTAGVLAIATVGAAALLAFAGALDARTGEIALPDRARIALHNQASQLGAAAVPVEVAPEQVGAVKTAIRLAFVDTFRLVMLICAGLAWLSALIAALLVERRFTAME
jgi:MFS family permease